MFISDHIWKRVVRNERPFQQSNTNPSAHPLQPSPRSGGFRADLFIRAIDSPSRVPTIINISTSSDGPYDAPGDKLEVSLTLVNVRQSRHRMHASRNCAHIAVGRVGNSG